MSIRSIVWTAVAALIVTLAIFGTSDLDVSIQTFFFNDNTGQWLLEKHEPIARFLFYTGAKGAIITFGVGCLITLIFSNRIPWAAAHRRGLLIIVLSLIAVPSTVGILKATTNVACPSHVERFGGKLPHVPVLKSYPDGTRPAKRQRCFPAGHASGGYALIALAALFQSARARRRAIAFAVSLGTVMAVYKMAIGDHFLSHTLVTLELAVILVGLIASAVYRRVPARFDRPPDGVKISENEQPRPGPPA